MIDDRLNHEVHTLRYIVRGRLKIMLNYIQILIIFVF